MNTVTVDNFSVVPVRLRRDLAVMKFLSGMKLFMTGIVMSGVNSRSTCEDEKSLLGSSHFMLKLKFLPSSKNPREFPLKLESSAACMNWLFILSFCIFIPGFDPNNCFIESNMNSSPVLWLDAKQSTLNAVFALASGLSVLTNLFG